MQINTKYVINNNQWASTLKSQKNIKLKMLRKQNFKTMIQSPKRINVNKSNIIKTNLKQKLFQKK